MSVSPQRRAAVVRRLRAMPRAKGPPPPRPPEGAGGERCELCSLGIGDAHRHLLHLVERRIVCVCDPCWAMRSGDAEYRPTGSRTRWLPDLAVPDELWARFAIPIGLAFFLHSAPAGRVVALYPSPAGATECELDLAGWELLVAMNPVLGDLEPDVEGLVIDRMATPHRYAIAPVDRCYELVGRIKASWEGISGGAGVGRAIDAFFEDLRATAGAR